MKMKYILFGIALLFFIFSLVRYLRKVEKAPAVTVLTITRFPKTFLDVGTQKLHVPVNVGFPVYNTGKNSLYIQKVEPDCHCTVANFLTNAIPPNDSSVITLKYDASNPGPFQSSAMVTTN